MFMLKVEHQGLGRNKASVLLCQVITMLDGKFEAHERERINPGDRGRSLWERMSELGCER